MKFESAGNFNVDESGTFSRRRFLGSSAVLVAGMSIPDISADEKIKDPIVSWESVVDLEKFQVRISASVINEIEDVYEQGLKEDREVRIILFADSSGVITKMTDIGCRGSRGAVAELPGVSNFFVKKLGSLDMNLLLHITHILIL